MLGRRGRWPRSSGRCTRGATLRRWARTFARLVGPGHAAALPGPRPSAGLRTRPRPTEDVLAGVLAREAVQRRLPRHDHGISPRLSRTVPGHARGLAEGRPARPGGCGSTAGRRGPSAPPGTSVTTAGAGSARRTRTRPRRRARHRAGREQQAGQRRTAERRLPAAAHHQQRSGQPGQCGQQEQRARRVAAVELVGPQERGRRPVHLGRAAEGRVERLVEERAERPVLQPDHDRPARPERDPVRVGRVDLVELPAGDRRDPGRLGPGQREQPDRVAQDRQPPRARAAGAGPPCSARPISLPAPAPAGRGVWYSGEYFECSSQSGPLACSARVGQISRARPGCAAWRSPPPQPSGRWWPGPGPARNARTSRRPRRCRPGSASRTR